MLPTRKKNFAPKKGMAIPLVLTFCVCVMVFAASLALFRKESKQQNLSSIHFIQANFMAQSAIQMMLLKLSAFPQEACDAGVLSLGYCPFRGIIASSTFTVNPSSSNSLGLSQFYSDCNTASFPLKVPDLPADWGSRVNDFKVISAYTDPGKRQLIISAQITAIGQSRLDRGGMDIRKEEMIKTVKLTREN